jgi:outer membrane scaffolding protein for murein synthesis (MipA/OmpV family)
MPLFRTSFAATIIALLASPAALAQQGPPVRAWAITVGAAPLIGPAFQGSDDIALSIFPDFRVNYKDKFFLSVPDGVGYNVVNTQHWKIGPLVKIRFGRDEKGGGNPFLIAGKSDDLQGLGDVGAAGEAGGFVQYSWKKVRTRAELRQGFGAHDGWVADWNASWFGARKLPGMGAAIYSLGPRLTLGGGDFIDPYFGIDSQQSADSGLATFSADSGLYSFGFSGSLVKPVNERFAVTAFASYDRLAGDVADSPLVSVRGSANQFVVGLAFGYRFLWGD